MGDNIEEIISLEEAERRAASGLKSGSHPWISAQHLGELSFPDVKWIVPGYLPEGCTILAGRPKLGKSWLALDVALAVARGTYCLGSTLCDQGDVLYMALEDNLRRIRSRIAKVSPPIVHDAWPHRLSIATEWLRCDDGGLEQIRSWAASVANPRLVIVDVLAQFRNGRSPVEGLYDSDYKAVKVLQELATELGIGILVVHHVRKGNSEGDPFERVSGTMGLTGAADTTMILDRDGAGCTLYARGRDIEEYERAISFDTESCRWIMQGDASEVRRSDERGAILAALDDSTEPMSPSDLQAATGMKSTNIRQLLHKMCKAGEVMKEGRGAYRPRTKASPGNNDHKITNTTSDGG